MSIRPATRLHHDVVVSIRFPRSEFCGLQTPYLHILTRTVLDQLWHQADSALSSDDLYRVFRTAIGIFRKMREYVVLTITPKIITCEILY